VCPSTEPVNPTIFAQWDTNAAAGLANSVTGSAANADDVDQMKKQKGNRLAVALFFFTQNYIFRGHE